MGNSKSTIKCTQGHLLKELNDTPSAYKKISANAGTVCDVCKKQYLASDTYKGFHCGKCQYDLCQTCAEPMILMA